MGSQSLASSIETALALRILSPLSVLIVLLWALSPVGGQSSLRLVSFEPKPIFSTKPIYYWSSNTTFPFGGESSSHYTTEPNAIQAIVASSLLAQPSTQLSPVDTWSNVKIPAVHSLVQATLEPHRIASSAWLDIDPTLSQDYASLVGIPMSNLPSEGTANFSIENSFIYTDCKRRKQLYSAADWCNTTYALANYACTFDSNGTYNSSILVTQSSILTTLTDDLDNNPTTYKPSRFNLQYAWSGGLISSATQPAITTYDCALYSVRVEANVFCTDSKCAVKRLRQSQVDRRPNEINAWNSYAAAKVMAPYTYLSALLNILNTATGTAYEGYGTPIDTYLYGLYNAYGEGDLFWGTTPPTNHAFSLRMTRLLNSAWIASQNTGGVSGDITAPVTNATLEEGGEFGNIATAVVSNDIEAYAAHYLWITLLLCVSTLLLLCAGCSMAISAAFISGPEILGRVSSLTRDSVYFPAYIGKGSALGGWERARVLRDVWVQVADVQPYAVTGRVAFTPADHDKAGGDEGEGLKRLKSWRLRRGRCYE